MPRHANKELNIDFALGYPGCDNRVAWEFRHIGLHVINPGNISRVIVTAPTNRTRDCRLENHRATFARVGKAQLQR